MQINGNEQDSTDPSNRNKQISNNNRTTKRSSPSNIQTNKPPDPNSQSFSGIGASDPKRSKFSNLSNTTITGSSLTHQSSDRIANINRGSLQDMTEASNQFQDSYDAQVPLMPSNSFEASTSASSPPFSAGPPSLLRIKEEASSSNSDMGIVGTNRGRISKSVGSYSAQQSMSEHVVIPTDPSLMQGM